MGNSESSNPVRNMDKRTARREYRTDFARAIANYRSTHVSRKSIKHGDISASDDWRDGNIKVFVRKRPIFKHELDAYEFDVATCTDDHTIVIHDARMHNDMKRQLINHHEFQFDRTFNENTKNDEVYNATAKSLVSIACDGGYSTCLVYGQTGSGKTFTMSSIYEHAAYDIFSQLEQVVERFHVAPTVTMSFVEIAGDYCHDLLNKFTPAQLLTGSDGSVHAFPVTEPTVGCAEELIAMIQHGMSVRTTAATGVHDQSSRSHAILRIYIQRHDMRPIEITTVTGTKSAVVEGVLTLVDLAGSEHRIDSMYHGKERRKETGNINASLMALKDCIRARASGKILGFQYRRSKLTMALKCSFTLPTARTIVIATVSPASKDTEHSLNTLRHACIMHGQQDNSKPGDRETRFVTGGTVVTEQIGEINLMEIGRKNANIKRAGGVMDGPKTNNGNLIVDSKAAKAANNEVELTDKERLRLRKAAETRSIAKLLPQYRDMLKHFRGLLGQNRQQASRLQRMPTDPNAVIEEELPYESPARSTSPGANSDAEQDEVDDPVNDFHSSLNKKDNRLDLHEIVKASGAMASQSDNESVEDDVDGYFERNCYDRQPGKSRKPSSPSNRAALKKLNERSPSGKKSSYYDNYEQEQGQDEEVEEEERMLAEEQRAQVPVPRSRSSKPAVVTAQPAVRPSSGSNQRSKAPAMSPPNPPTSRDERPSPGQKRLEFQKLYNTIYDGAEGCPEHILRRQLTSLLGLHGYTESEIELMFEMHALMQENESMKRAAQARAQRPAPKAEQPARPQQRQQQYEDAPVQKRSQREPVYHDEEPVQVPVPRGKVVNSPVQSAVAQPRAAEYHAEESTNSAKRSSSTRRDTTSAAPDKAAALNKLPTSLAQEQKQARLAEEKERREQEAMAEAAAALEQQNALRKARQDAAKALRDQQEEARRRKAAELKPAPKKAAAEPAAARNNLDDPIETSSTAAASRNSIRKHEDEISSLMEQLSMEGNTEATNYALKKSIAVRKAALLRERRAAAQKSYQEDEYEEPVVPIKKASRYGASFDVNLDAAGQPPAPLERGGSSKSASRPKPAGFDAPSRSEYDDYAPGRKVQNSPPRGGVQNNGAFSSRVAQARAVDPSEAFGGPRWQGADEQDDPYYQQAEPYQQQQNRRSSSNLPTQSGGGGGSQFKSPQQLRMEQYHGYSPRGGQQDSYEEPVSSRQVRASPRIEEPVPVQRRRVVGAAAAPFGNDYSYDQTP